MIRSGDLLSNPVTGHRYHILQTGADTGGALLEMEVTFSPGVLEPPDHLHPQQEERFEVLAGALQLRLNGAERQLRQGETLVIPAGTPHAMWNLSAVEARVRWQTRPALRSAEFFAATTRLAAAGRVNARGRPGLLDGALLLDTYRAEIRLTRPAAALQDLVFGPLALLARMLGRSL